GRGTERKGSDQQGWGGGASQTPVLGVGLSRTLRPGTRGQGFLGLVHRRLRPSGGLGASGAIHTEPDGQPRSAGPQTQWSPCLLRTHPSVCRHTGRGGWTSLGRGCGQPRRPRTVDPAVVLPSRVLAAPAPRLAYSAVVGGLWPPAQWVVGGTLGGGHLEHRRRTRSARARARLPSSAGTTHGRRPDRQRGLRHRGVGLRLPVLPGTLGRSRPGAGGPRR